MTSAGCPQATVERGARPTQEEGVVTCLLTAMSLLAFPGLKYPAHMLPILLFEVAWKVIWMASVAMPAAVQR